MIQSLIGKNRYGLKTALDLLVENFVQEHGPISLERIDGEEASYEQIVGAVESMPFLAEKKLVLIRELGQNKTVAERIEAICSKTSDTTDLVIVEQKPDKRSIYYKYLKKYTDFKEFDVMPPYDLARWIVEVANAQEATISTRDAQYLVEQVGDDQQLLAQELAKLIIYNPDITKETINLNVEASPEGTIFNLVEASFGTNPKRAIELYDMQRLQRTEPQAILGMLAWQMHAVALLKSAGTTSVETIAKEAGMNPFVLRKTKTIAEKFERRQIQAILEDLLDLDKSSKQESVNMDDALKRIILKLATRAY